MNFASSTDYGKICGKCGIKIGANLVHCPNCGAHQEDTADTPFAYKPIDRRTVKLQRLVPDLAKILLVANIAVVLLNIFLITFAEAWGQFTLQSLWSLYPVCASILAYLAVLRPIIIKEYYWHETVFLSLAAAAFVILVDLFTDIRITWSVTYVLPGFFAAVSIALCIVMLARRADVGNMILLLFILFLLASVLFALSATVFMENIVDFNVYPALACFITNFAVFGIAALVKRNDLIRMFKRRFHI